MRKTKVDNTKIYLHVGLCKTYTTSFQLSIFNKITELINIDYYYYGQNNNFKAKKLHSFFTNFSNSQNFFFSKTKKNLINNINSSDGDELDKVKKILILLVTFSERNPGLARLLTREAFSVDETSLDERIGQMMSKIELLMKQNLQKYEQATKNKLNLPTASAANLLLACSEGIIQQFVRSGFQDSPTKRINDQFEFLISALKAN